MYATNSMPIGQMDLNTCVMACEETEGCGQIYFGDNNTCYFSELQNICSSVIYTQNEMKNFAIKKLPLGNSSDNS